MKWQQAEVVKMHTDLKVGMYWGEMGVDFWNGATWDVEMQKHEVIILHICLEMSN